MKLDSWMQRTLADYEAADAALEAALESDDSSSNARIEALSLIVHLRRGALAAAALTHIGRQVPDLVDEVAELNRILYSEVRREEIVDRLVTFAREESLACCEESAA